MNRRIEVIDTITNEIFKVSGISVNDIHGLDLKDGNFSSIGLCSLDIVQLIISLEEMYSIEIDYELNNVYSLADFILENGEKNERIK